MKTTLGKMTPQLLGMMFKKTGTVRYPFVSAKVPDTFRGALKFNGDLCVGCKLCERVCPCGALKIEKVDETSEERRFKATLRMDKCIFCGQCVDSCNKSALENTSCFELASPDKASLTVEI